jgi:alanine racemase
MDAMTVRVDLGAIRDNLAIVRSLAGRRTVMACIKGNAYGHGLLPVARTLEAAGVPWLTLGSPGEALALRDAGIGTPVLLFPTIAGLDLTRHVAAGITIGVQAAADAASLAGEARTPVSVFLKIDAGFGRVGAPLHAAVAEARAIARLPSVTLAGVFTHLPFFGEDSVPWIRDRLKVFGDVAATIESDAGRPLVIQALASTGLACGLDAPMTNAVCPGSLLYGVQPGWTSASGRSVDVAGLRPALVSVRSVVGSLRTIETGERFGPGGVRTAARATRVGVVPLGFSNSILVRKPGQRVAVAGRPAPVLSVSLEHTVLDLTDAEPVAEGSVVSLLSRDPSDGPTLGEVAHVQERAAVEVLVALTGKATYEYGS